MQLLPEDSTEVKNLKLQILRLEEKLFFAEKRCAEFVEAYESVLYVGSNEIGRLEREIMALKRRRSFKAV